MTACPQAQPDHMGALAPHGAHVVSCDLQLHLATILTVQGAKLVIG